MKVAERHKLPVIIQISTSGIVCMHAKSLQLCLTLCDPMDCRPSGSSVCGILQARILELVAMGESHEQRSLVGSVQESSDEGY